MYSLPMFGRMFTDGTRHEAHAEALRRTVKPGDVVLDIGTGTGLYAFLAHQLGARRVFALENNPLIEVGREIARRNGIDGIEFIDALSTDIDLPEQADVIVADLRGTLPYNGQHLPSLADAVRRHLAPGGVLIPRRDRVFAAVANSPKAASDLFDPWLRNPLGIDMSIAATMAANSVRGDKVALDDLLTDPVEIATIDYHALDAFDLDASWECEPSRAGTAHGISVWFEASPIDGITYTTGPTNHRSVYGMAMFPFDQPIELSSGDHLSLRLRAVLSDDYAWSWTTDVRGPAGEPKVQLRQSTLLGVPLSRDRVHARAASTIPDLSARAAVDRVALGELLGGASLGATADVLIAQFSDRFADRGDALTYVADLAATYSS